MKLFVRPRWDQTRNLASICRFSINCKRLSYRFSAVLCWSFIIVGELVVQEIVIVCPFSDWLINGSSNPWASWFGSGGVPHPCAPMTAFTSFASSSASLRRRRLRGEQCPPPVGYDLRPGERHVIGATECAFPLLECHGLGRESRLSLMLRYFSNPIAVEGRMYHCQGGKLGSAIWCWIRYLWRGDGDGLLVGAFQLQLLRWCLTQI